MNAKSRGQGLVEFALILPILLLLLLGIVEGARIAWAYITIQEAAREAARYAVSGQPYNPTGDPWTFGAAISDGYGGLCLQAIDNFGTCDTVDPTASNAIDRVEAISNIAIAQARGLPVDRYAITTATFTATGYYDAPETLGVLVKGQTSDTDLGGTFDNAGKEGLNVWVSVYYNVEMLDPIYTGLIQTITGGSSFIRVRGEVQMQNEGVDTALGSIPPAGIATPVAPAGGTGGGASGLQPIIQSPDGNSFEAGSTMRVRIEQHTAGNHYDIYLGAERICSNVLANNFGIAEPNCQIPPDYPPGEDYELYSTLSGGTLEVAGDVYIDITRLGEPTLLVADGYTWPAGSRITLQVRSHDPHTAYELYFQGGVIGAVTTDEYGDANYDWTIPSGTPAREEPNPPYALESLEQGTSSPVIADSGIYVTIPQIVVQGGNTWPAGAMIMANLRRHAPNRDYEVRCNGLSVGSFTTDSEGRSMATIFCTIPDTMADSPPYYTIESYDGGILIATQDVTVFTPDEPYIVIPGGYDWPAGSPIDIQMFKHEPNRAHKIWFEDWSVINSITTDSAGFAQIAYIIPITAAEATTYTVRSYDLVDDVTVATRTVTVRAQPQISVSEGAVVQPNTIIHINLTQHARDAVYSLLLDGLVIGAVQTDGSGEASFGYDLSLFPSTGGPFVLESQLSGARAAYTELSIVAANLEVVSIEFPETPLYNEPMPITVTIRNTSTVTLSGVWFDTDIYIDPSHVPDPYYPYPPGDYKLWIDYLAPGGTASFVQEITLYGAQDHTIYARTNTSKYIEEVDAANPANNMLDVVVAPQGCGSQVKEAITTDGSMDSAFSAGWADVAFGNASPASASINNDVISITSEGSGTVANNDASTGYYLYYQTVSGDFDVSVRAVSQSTFSGISQWAKFGLEVRDSAASDARKVYLLETRSERIQYGYRTTDGGSVSRDAVTGSPLSPPVWLRIVRVGDAFSLYYADTATTPPADEDWVYWNTYVVQMSDPVIVGLANASYSSNNSNTVTFDNLDMCIDPANAAGCGAVREETGLVVVNATNFVDNIDRGGKYWQEVTMDGRRVMQALPNTGTNNNTGYTTASPELQYQVEIETAGDYYVWVYGAGDGIYNESLHVGINGAANDLSDRIQMSGDNTIAWTNDTMDGVRAVINNVGAGTNIINVWMREDGAWFNKILLTTNPNYVPTGDIDQSPCVAASPNEPYPPGMTICTPPDAPLLENGDFEDNPRYQTAWQGPLYNVGTNIASTNPYEGNLGVRMTSYQSGVGFKQPFLWQQFTMADWITGTTTMNLSLWKSVNDQGTSEITDTLQVVLRTTAMTPTLVASPTLVARGSQGFGYPDNYVNLAVDLVPAMTSAGHNPVNYANQDLQLYFYDTSNSLSCTGFGPNCFGTDFYMDNIELEICTSQPIPDPDPTKAIVTGNVRVWIGGIPTAKQGVRVWTYRQNGAMLTTYSIHDSTYGFYALDPGEYVLYSEWWEGPDLYNALTTLTVSAGVQYVRNLDLY
jgi:hypothetical protein